MNMFVAVVEVMTVTRRITVKRSSDDDVNSADESDGVSENECERDSNSDNDCTINNN